MSDPQYLDPAEIQGVLEADSVISWIRVPFMVFLPEFLAQDTKMDIPSIVVREVYNAPRVEVEWRRNIGPYYLRANARSLFHASLSHSAILAGIRRSEEILAELCPMRFLLAVVARTAGGPGKS